jgi:hypothetical protein
MLICLLLVLLLAAPLYSQTTRPAEDRRTEAGPAPPTQPAARLARIELAHQKKRDLLAKYPPPIALCKKVAEGSIKIDGRLDDAGWAGATGITGLRGTRDGLLAKKQTRIKLAWDEKFLYIAFDCDDADVVSTIKEHDGPMWSQDAAEVFIDANGDEMSYVELETSPLGTLYDAAIADYRPETDWSSPRMDNVDIAKSVKLMDSKASRIATAVRGTLNDPSDRDAGWTCEMAVAWSDLAAATPTRPHGLPPRDGDVMLM